MLIHGGTSGIGLTAIQLAKQHRRDASSRPSGSDEKVAFCRTMGADHAINYRTQDFVAEVARITGKRGVDVVLDMVGGDYIEKNLQVPRARRAASSSSPSCTAAASRSTGATS